MCGILGYYNIDGRPVERERDDVVRLRDTMRSRGPDSEGYLAGDDGRWILAHRRLKILDLSDHGHQPMSDRSGSLHLCYNGEIYNFRALRAELEALGYEFKSTSDTEVILYLYRHYGLQCFARLEGMFALMIVDEDEGRAVIARDPVGKKPIYYSRLGRDVMVASDPGVISRDARYQRAVSPEGLYSALTMGGVKSPRSLFRGIHKLEPGCYLVLDGGFDDTAAPTRFIEFEFRRAKELVDDDNAIDTLDALLDRAVEKRMISDVPFGVFLSGGIDSALILAYMSRHTSQVNTFSIDLVTSEEDKKETSVASGLATQFGTNHHSVQLKDDEYIEILDEVVLKNSTFAIPDAVLIAKLSELARSNGVIVIETGEGADELFLGYQNYLQSLDSSYAKMGAAARIPIPRFLARVASAFGSDAKKDRMSYMVDALDNRAHGLIMNDFLYEPFFSYQSTRLVSKYLGTSVTATKYAMLNDSIVSRLHPVEAYSPSTLSVAWNASFRWADFLLDRIDNFTMAASVEGRAPFLDIDVINYGLSLADRWKVRGERPKYVLRQIAERHVSQSHAALPKRGFGGGNDNMLTDRVCDYMRSKIAASPSYRSDPLLDLDHIETRSQLFTLTSFHAWVDYWM